MQRHPDGQADRVRGAADDFRCAAADVQCGGYYRGGAVQRKPVSGGGGLYHGADRNFHEPIYRHFSGSQCAGGPVLRGGSGPEMSETVHTSILVALLSGVAMAFVGVGMARWALEVMATPDDVIDLSTLYMRIYFLGMPFFMLYNYGAAILRAVGDTRRPLLFLIVAGVANAVLNVILVVKFHMAVEGVAIATVVSQLISCILVLRCLYRSESSYQLRFSKLRMNVSYLVQIFQVGIPAGIQSVVINFSNAMLQSSVNSFGSTAMAGYTAANNLLGFLYASVNSVTQACMSFTSQNYGVGKFKRMDRVLIDCALISVVFAEHWERFFMYSDRRFYRFIQRIRKLSKREWKLFPLQRFPIFCAASWICSGRHARHGTVGRADDFVDYRNGGNQNRLDLRDLSAASVLVRTIYFLSGILADYDCHAGDLLLYRAKTGAGALYVRWKIDKTDFIVYTG